MIELKTALILVIIHLVYYFYLQLFSDIMRMGMVKNTPNKTIDRLRTKYHINIRTYQKNNAHFGFAWFKTIYLNENLFRKEKALMFTFYHELFHIRGHHKINTLLQRLAFSLTPLFLSFFHYSLFIVVYVSFAYLMYLMNQSYEKQANEFANQMITENGTKIDLTKRESSH